jgi:hypothetical protein
MVVLRDFSALVAKDDSVGDLLVAMGDDRKTMLLRFWIVVEPYLNWPVQVITTGSICSTTDVGYEMII